MWQRNGSNPRVHTLLDDSPEMALEYAHTGVAVFDAADLAAELTRSPFRTATAIRVRYDGTGIRDLIRGMQVLAAFCGKMGNPPVRLYVKDLRLTTPIRFFRIPNLAVYGQGRRRDYDDDLSGELVRPLPPDSALESEG